MMIKRANPDQYQDVRSFYFKVIDGIAELPYGAGWKKDIYPAPEFLQESIQAGDLYIAEESGEIIAAMVLNHRSNDGYKQVEWQTLAEDSEVMLIHALGVDTPHTCKGIGRQMVEFAIRTAREQGQKVIRLDVLKGNLPAAKLYTGIGFQYLQTVTMFYEDTGWTEYELYEYLL